MLTSSLRWVIVIGGVCLLVGGIVLFMVGDPSPAEKDLESATSPPDTKATSPVQSVPTPAAPTQREEPVEQLYRAIQEAAKGQTVTEDVLRRIEGLREAGRPDSGTDLRELYGRDGSVQERTIILLALQKVGTPQALAALKEIALKPGSGARTLGPRAVQAMAALTKDSNQISELLLSESPEARDAAATALSGKELTDVSVRRLGELLRSDSWVTHNLVAAAFATDRSEATADGKAALLFASLPQLERLKDPEKIVPSTGVTARQSALVSYVRALAGMPAADKSLRERLVAAPAGSLEHKVSALALALRKDKTVYPSIVPLAREEQDGLLRLLAVEGLGLVGSAQDLGLLENIANTDPYTRPSMGDRMGQSDRMVYPVRVAAKRAMVTLGKRGSDKP